MYLAVILVIGRGRRLAITKAFIRRMAGATFGYLLTPACSQGYYLGTTGPGPRIWLRWKVTSIKAPKSETIDIYVRQRGAAKEDPLGPVHTARRALAWPIMRPLLGELRVWRGRDLHTRSPGAIV